MSATFDELGYYPPAGAGDPASLVGAAWAATVYRLSGGRSTLGIGRGIAAVYAGNGSPSVTEAGR